MSSFELVFDASQSGYKAWSFSAHGLLAVAIGAFLLFTPRRMQKYIPNSFRGGPRIYLIWLVFAFAIFWTVVAFASTYSEYRTIQYALERGEYSTVEGPVVNFQPMPYYGHREESFQVNGVTFSYSDYGITNGFNNTASHGGPIRAGIYVKIAYLGNKIIRLEIKR